MRTLAEVQKTLQTGTTSRSLIEACLTRIADPAGEGSRAFTKVSAEAAREASDRHDRERSAGKPSGPFAGIPISVKDLFDVAGEVTTAGSVVLRDAPPAKADAPTIARVKAAGFVPVGRTNMTEFAYSGLGVNPHYGTPRNIYDRQHGRIPGGSSSGAAVSITDEMSYAALGTDTGGSCRIPAALCGIVGFKPTAKRIPLEGVFPLSHSLDSIGSLAASVACVADVDAVLAGESVTPLAHVDVKSLRFAVPQTYVLDGVDQTVAKAFEEALAKLRNAGATIVEIPLRELAELPGINSKGGFPAAEAYALHKDMMAQKGGQYDPRVLVRIMRGTEQTEADYRALRAARADLIEHVGKVTAEYDALLMPTVPVVAPLLSEVEPEEAFGRLNLLMLRNPTVSNFLDRCAMSVPCHRAGDAPVGLGLTGEHGADRKLLAIGAAIEKLVSPSRS